MLNAIGRLVFFVMFMMIAAVGFLLIGAFIYAILSGVVAAFQPG